MDRFNVKEMDVVILCGGKGTRLQSLVNDRSKVMVPIDGRPFLDILIRYLAGYGARRIILCTGHLSESVTDYFQDYSSEIEILFSKEPSPLGTAGALKHAEHLIESPSFFVLNGDSFCKVDIKDMVCFHRQKNSWITVAVTGPASREDAGFVRLDTGQRIVQFCEKDPAIQIGYMNAGMYIFEKSVLSLIPPEVVFSLEYDLLSDCTERAMYGYVTREPVYDIGTPPRLLVAREILAQYQGVS